MGPDPHIFRAGGVRHREFVPSVNAGESLPAQTLDGNAQDAPEAQRMLAPRFSVGK
jgi:hypothetical protein